MKKEFLSQLQLISELGLTIACAVIISVLAGTYLDKRLSGKGLFTLIFLLFGLGAGFLGAWRLIKKAASLEDKDADAKKKNYN